MRLFGPLQSVMRLEDEDKLINHTFLFLPSFKALATLDHSGHYEHFRTAAELANQFSERFPLSSQWSMTGQALPPGNQVQLTMFDECI